MCPICRCKCNVAYTNDAAQVLAVKKLLDTHAIENKKEVSAQKGRMALASIIGDVAAASVQVIQNSRNPYSQKDLEQMTLTNAAHAVSRGFNPADNHDFIAELRTTIGKPTSRVHLPTAITAGNHSTNIVDLRGVLESKSAHRKNNNYLSDTTNAGFPPVPLHPYRNVCWTL